MNLIRHLLVTRGLDPRVRLPLPTLPRLRGRVGRGLDCRANPRIKTGDGSHIGRMSAGRALGCSARTCGIGFLATLAALAAMMVTAAAQDAGPPKLHTNETYVEEVTRNTTLAVDDPMAVFAFVLTGLPDHVKVYPTENYYYFTFVRGGTPYAGNIRIEPGDGDKVTVHFVYYQDWSEWRQDSALTHVVLDGSRGVTVEKLERLVYRLSYGGKSVVFALNDLSQVRPPAGALAPGETFIGPIFDESAVRFFLVYNSKRKVFHYILDETVNVADEFFRSRRSNRILIGKRTGFAFYQDRLLDRKILVGVYEGNYRLNTYFDGPFDQLPDNFIEGETLRQAILEVSPRLKGKIDRFGSAPDGAVRFLIKPYASYQTESDLYGVDKCARTRVGASSYYECFVAEPADRDFGALPSDGRKKGKRGAQS
jgi:hypothetical protein